jgi:hypothetical protein
LPFPVSCLSWASGRDFALEFIVTSEQ